MAEEEPSLELQVSRKKRQVSSSFRAELITTVIFGFLRGKGRKQD